MRIQCLLLLAIACSYGCEQSNNTTTTANRPVTETTTTVTPAADPTATTDPAEAGPATHETTPVTTEPAAPDNSAVNARDNDSSAKTPIDQNENEADIKITADIRKRVLQQPDFSVNARNVKIITADGKVTLRGPVTNEAERDAIVKIAHEIAGDEHVDSHLEVTP